LAILSQLNEAAESANNNTEVLLEQIQILQRRVYELEQENLRLKDQQLASTPALVNTTTAILSSVQIPGYQHLLTHFSGPRVVPSVSLPPILEGQRVTHTPSSTPSASTPNFRALNSDDLPSEAEPAVGATYLKTVVWEAASSALGIQPCAIIAVLKVK
jgi:hypothetical protein